MPVATISEENVRKELRTAPPDGYVILRQLSYEEMLTRRDMASRMSMAPPSKKGNDENERVQFEPASLTLYRYSFARAIIDHNLTDKNGVALDFNNPMTFRVLNPIVASEIESYIDELSQEAEPDLEDFTQHASSSTKVPTNSPDADLDAS